MRFLDVVEQMFLRPEDYSKTNPAGVDDVPRVLRGVEVRVNQPEVFLQGGLVLREEGEVTLPAG